MKAFLFSELEFDSSPIVPSFIKDNKKEKKYSMVDLQLAFVKSNNTDAEQTLFLDEHELLQKKITYQTLTLFASKTRPNIAVVIGKAGSGKTSLLKTILRHHELKKLYEYVFFLQCHHVDFRVKTNLLQLLATTLPYQWIQDKTSCVDVLQELEKSEQVLILIDDFSQVLANLSPQDSTATSIHDEANAKSFMQGILSRRLLPKAILVITARTNSFFNLDKHLTNFSIFRILGLSQKARKELCLNVCEKMAEPVLCYIKSHHDLLSFCNTPENCAAVMYVVSSFMKQQSDDSAAGADLPLTRVAIAAFALILQSKRVRPKEKVLKQLAALSWKKLNQKALNSSVKELTSEKSYFGVNSTLINVNNKSNMKYVRKVYDLWRDILAAIHCNFYMKLEDFESAFTNFPNEFKRFASIYLDELCYRPTTRYLRKLLSSCKIHPDKQKLIQNYVKETG